MDQVKNGDIRLVYRVYGKGIPMVFVPPPAVGSPVFRLQADELAKDFQVILPELRGHGGSDPSDVPLTYSVIVQDVAAMLDNLNISKVVMCGYSMGGSVVFEFMRTFPARIIAGIPLSGFSEVSDLRFKAEISTAIAFTRVRAMRSLAFGLSLANAESIRSFREMYRVGVKASQPDVKTMFQHALKFNCTADLHKIDKPVLLLFGGKDSRIYPYAKIAKAHLPKADMVFIPGARHQIPLKHHREVNQQIRTFLGKL